MAKRTRIIALMAGLLLFAAQLASVLHATEHTFHAHSDICVSFVSMEQHDFAVTCPALAAECDQPADEFNYSGQMLVVSSFINANQARAPPLLT